MEALVELDHVSKFYEDKAAVRDLSLKIEAGSMFGLLGPNGAGKTSTIRMMIGITLPDAGKVSLFGKPFGPAALKRVGYLPEERGLYKRMKVIDQLVFLGELRGLGALEATRRAKAWCERLQMADSIDKKTEELSKGMQQKIQFIATLLHDPELIIMDEPFSGLDLLMLEKTSELIQKVANMDELNTIIVVTHDITAASAVADHLWLMGRDHDAKGNPLPGSHIVETYDLVERDLCWHPQIITQPKFMEFVREVKDRFRSL